MLLLRRPGDNEDASSCCNRRGAKLIVHSPTPQLLFAQHIMLLPSLRFVKADELLCSQVQVRPEERMQLVSFLKNPQST